MRFGAGRQVGGPGEGIPAGLGAGAGPGTLLGGTANRGCSAHPKLGGRGRRGGDGATASRRRLGEGGFLYRALPYPLPGAARVPEIGGSPALREKSLKWVSSELGDGTQRWGALRSYGGCSEVCEGRRPQG